MQKLLLWAGAGLLLGASQPAQAQYRGRGGNVSLGLKVGGTLTSFVGADTKNAAGNTIYDYRFGFLAGGFVNIGFARLFAFQPEILYSQKGAKDDKDQGARLQYIDVPLAFHLNTDGFFFEAGPQVGFLTSARYQSGSASVSVIDGYKTVDFGYLAGLGYQLKHGPGVGLRYNGAFTNFPNSTTSGSTTFQPRARNSAFQLYATYSFN
ncbi:MAG: porin family protein [Janthinobacterium lividum]